MEKKILTAETAPGGERRTLSYSNIMKLCKADAEYINGTLLPALHRAGLRSVTWEQIITLCESPWGLTELRTAVAHPVRYPSLLQYRGGRAVLSKKDMGLLLEGLKAKEGEGSENG